MTDVFKLCFLDKEASIDGFDEIIAELHKIGSDFWRDGDDYAFFADGSDTCVSWLERSEGTLDINGGTDKPSDLTLVPYEKWRELALEVIKGE